jgi:hypothetical protein
VDVEGADTEMIPIEGEAGFSVLHSYGSLCRPPRLVRRPMLVFKDHCVPHRNQFWNVISCDCYLPRPARGVADLLGS